MKYFTREWCSGGLSDEENDRIWEDYKKYIKDIYWKLPFVLKILTNDISLHDGIIKKTYFYVKEGVLEFSGIFGDLQIGYFGLNIKYFDVYKMDTAFLKSLFYKEKAEILYDEIEILPDNKYSHKLIFTNGKEMEIIFNDIELKITNEIPANYKKESSILEVLD